MPFTSVTPLAFSVSDGVQTLTVVPADQTVVPPFTFATDAAGDITQWQVHLGHPFAAGLNGIETDAFAGALPGDVGRTPAGFGE